MKSFSDYIRASKGVTKDENKKAEPGRDLDDEIARLQKSLEEDSSSSEDSDDDSESDTGSQGDEEGRVGVVCLSSVGDEVIPPLAPHLLPAISCAPGSKKRKAATKADVGGGSDDSMKAKQPLPKGGLAKVVAEMSYSSRSETKGVPFMCRRCDVRCKNIEEFEKHKASKECQEKEDIWERGLRCGVCKKSFTSRVQMQEHFMSKKHREMLDIKGGGRGGRGRGRGRGGRGGMMMGGRGRGGLGRGGQDRRQWS